MPLFDRICRIVRIFFLINRRLTQMDTDYYKSFPFLRSKQKEKNNIPSGSLSF